MDTVRGRVLGQAKSQKRLEIHATHAQPDTGLRASCTLTHVIAMTTLGERYRYSSHFPLGEQRGQGICSDHTALVAELELKPRPSFPL